MKWFSLADQLFVAGWTFYSDSTLIDITEIVKSVDLNKPLDYKQRFETMRCVAPFEHVILQVKPVERFGRFVKPLAVDGFELPPEFVSDDHSDNQTHRIGLLFTCETTRTFDLTVSCIVSYMIDGENFWACPLTSCIDFSFEGYVNHIRYFDTCDYLKNQLQSTPLKQRDLQAKNIPIEALTGAFPFVLDAFIHMHEKRDVEFVDFSKNRCRWAKRKLGKQPSPYFLLKVDNKPVQEYLGDSGVSGKKQSLPLHIVRGHFMTHPDDHPLPQFAGKTFWLPDHVKGKKERGVINKGYTIRLD